ncbi:hypothetical protein CLIB1423_01S02762 [[Candida] railenensis]|uniref:Uncharacterized protein n=1 Tax=[Candida] railenensis TaxID=45579 RepID=A0A9P0VVA8_9ASCO|nr:hypothetical protein CLIB1423_01S02762 [[Candida] railenensis]
MANKSATSRNKFKKVLSSKTPYSFKNDGSDVLLYLTYIKFLNSLQSRVDELKEEAGSPENLAIFYKQAASEVLPKFRG